MRIIISLLALSTLLIFLYGCFEKPSEPILPTWDVDLTLPILDKAFDLNELVKKDTTHLKVGENGQIYYSATEQLKATKVGDNLKISDISTTSQTKFGNFEIKDPGTVTANIKAYEIFPTLSQTLPPGNYVIPSNAPGIAVSKNFTTFDNFQWISLDDGILKITITNGLPVPIMLVWVKIYSQNDLSNPILTISENDTVGANSSKIFTSSLAGKTLPSSLVFTALVFSPGSGGVPVFLDINQMFITISGKLENLSIAAASARIPAQTNPVLIDSSFALEPNEQYPHLIDQVIFKSGEIKIKLINNIDLGLNGNLTLYNLRRKTNNAPLQISINIGRKNSSNSVFERTINLADYKFVGNLSNRISYRLEVYAEDTGNDFRTISKNDGVSAEISLRNIIFESISGKLKPTEIRFEERKIELSGLRDYRENFKGSLRLDDIRLEVNLTKTVQLTFDLNLKIKAVNDKTGKIDSLEIPPDQRRFSGTSHRIILTKNNSNIVNFINSFISNAGEIPEYILVYGTIILNPTYEVGQVSSTDSIFGSTTVSFSSSFGISDAEFKDTSEVEELSDETKRELDKINHMKLFVEVENKLGVGLKFRATFLNPVMDSLFSIPKNRNFEILPAQVDADGFSIAKTKVVNVIELEKDDIQKLKNLKFVRSFVTLGTSENGRIVKFRTTDSIKVKIYGRVNYKIETSNK